MALKVELREILVLEPDRSQAALVARAVSRTFPAARVYCETVPATAAALLAERPIELFVVAVRGFDLDTVTLLGAWADHGSPQTRVLVMTPDVHCGAVTALRSLPITGVFDSSSSDLRELEFACRAVASGAKYWCPKVAEASASNPAPRRSPGLASGEMLWRLAPPRPVQFHRRTRRKDD